MNTMSFGGWAPELINGRVAQIAFVAGLGAELSTGQSFTEQFAAHTGSIVFASGLITLASFMPNMQATDEYTANPASLGKSNGPWTTSAEMTNGRGAMVGLVAMLLVEKAIGGPLTGIFSGADSDELFASTFYDDSFAAQVGAPAPAPAKFADFDSTVVAPAPVAAGRRSRTRTPSPPSPSASRAPPTRRWRRRPSPSDAPCPSRRRPPRTSPCEKTLIWRGRRRVTRGVVRYTASLLCSRE